MPAGEHPNGNDILWPKHVVEVSALETSINTRLRTRYFWYAVVFSDIVTWSVEPELMNSTYHSIRSRKYVSAMQEVECSTVLGV